MFQWTVSLSEGQPPQYLRASEMCGGGAKEKLVRAWVSLPLLHGEEERCDGATVCCGYPLWTDRRRALVLFGCLR